MGQEPPEPAAAAGVDASAPTLAGFAPEVSWSEDPYATVRPADEAAEQVEVTGDLTAVAALPRWSHDELVVERTLGVGGMGVVRAARQLSFDRDVAVKQLRPEHQSPSAQRKLLQEGWAAGCLEHPHIVPVYSMARDQDGLPMIVQKHLHGTTWSVQLKADHAHAVGQRVGGAVLEAHLDVLERVAQAVAFAHDRGIVHRDIKPHNVMLGRFGEVTLLDWGLAVALAHGDARLPSASAARLPAGTPSYMAPEQLAEDERHCGPGTDVYLLGAVLYEILVGRAPHTGPSVAAILDKVRVNRPAVPAELDPDARTLLLDSLGDDPEARPSAVVFLDRLRQHRTLSGARRLLEQALDERDAAEVALEEGDLPAALQHTSAARFGLVAAEQAGATVDEASRMHIAEPVVRHHLEAGDGRAAVLLLDQLGVGSGELRLAAEQTAATQAVDRARVERLAGEADMARGIRTRLYVGLVTISTWIAAPVGVFAYETLVAPLPYELLLPGTVISGLFSLVLVRWARDSLSLSIPNRVTAIALPAATWMLVLAQLYGWWEGLPPWRSLVLAQTAWFGIALVTVPIFGRSMYLVAATHLVGIVIATLRPDLVWLVIAVLDVVFAAAVFYPQREEAMPLFWDWAAKGFRNK